MIVDILHKTIALRLAISIEKESRTNIIMGFVNMILGVLYVIVTKYYLNLVASGIGIVLLLLGLVQKQSKSMQFYLSIVAAFLLIAWNIFCLSKLSVFFNFNLFLVIMNLIWISNILRFWLKFKGHINNIDFSGVKNNDVFLALENNQVGVVELKYGRKWSDWTSHFQKPWIYFMEKINDNLLFFDIYNSSYETTATPKGIEKIGKKYLTIFGQDFISGKEKRILILAQNQIIDELLSKKKENN